MNKKLLYTLWGGLFILCAGLGFIPAAEGAAALLMTALSVVFFLPPALLVYRAVRERDTLTLTLIRNIALVSLALTVVTLILNFMSLMASELLGNILYIVLVIVSSPMVCSGYWVLSLFLWACLLMVCLSRLRKQKK